MYEPMKMRKSHTFAAGSEEIEAAYFFGGEENGKEISEWINANGGSAIYTTGSPEVLTDGLRIPEKPEGIWIRQKGGPVHVVPMWFFVKDKVIGVFPMESATFNWRYEAIPVESSDSE